MSAIDDIAQAHAALDRAVRSTTPDITITAYGTPGPQGSKSHVGGGRLIESSKKVKPWREAVGAATAVVLARQARLAGRPIAPLDGPLSVEIAFTVVKPASAPKRRVTWPITRSSGDLDKLVRATFDAIDQADAIKDDARIVEVSATKCYPGEGYEALDRPGAIIRIWRIGGAS